MLYISLGSESRKHPNTLVQEMGGKVEKTPLLKIGDSDSRDLLGVLNFE